MLEQLIKTIGGYIGEAEKGIALKLFEIAAENAIRNYNSGKEDARSIYERISKAYSEIEPKLTETEKAILERNVFKRLREPSDYALRLNESEALYSTARKLLKEVNKNDQIDPDLAAIVSEWFEDNFKPTKEKDVYGTRMEDYLRAAENLKGTAELREGIKEITHQKGSSEEERYRRARKIALVALDRDMAELDLLKVAEWYLEKHIPEKSYDSNVDKKTKAYAKLKSAIHITANTIEGIKIDKLGRDGYGVAMDELRRNFYRRTDSETSPGYGEILSDKEDRVIVRTAKLVKEYLKRKGVRNIYQL